MYQNGLRTVSSSGLNMSEQYYAIIEKALQKRKGSVEQSIHSTEAEYRELVDEVRVYNDSMYSCMRKEFQTVKSLPNELISGHVTREKQKRTRKRLAQKRGLKITNRGGSSSKSAYKLSSKRKETHKAKRKVTTSQALHSSIPGTHLTPLSTTSTEDGIDAIFAAGKSTQKEPIKNGGATESIGQTSSALTPLPLRSPPLVHKVQSTSGSSKVTSPTAGRKVPSASMTFMTKGKQDSLGKTGASGFNKGLKHDVQLFTILDTTVNPPLPRYIAKIVPESTALIPWSSGARNPPTVGSTLATLAPAHTSVSSTHSTSSSTPTPSGPTHSKPVLTTAIPRSSTTLAQSKSNSMIATGSRGAHRDSTTSSATKLIATAPKKVIKPITPPTVYVCDQSGCRESFSQMEMLNLHKLTVHRQLPRLISNKNQTARYNGARIHTEPEVVAAPQALVDGSKQIIKKVSNKRVCSPSSSEEDIRHKFIKLDNGKSSLTLVPPVYNTARQPCRNFARKSTGQSCSMKRKRVSLKRMQLNLRKVSTKGLKLLKRTTNQVMGQNPMSKWTTPHGYRNPEFFRNLIRSQLKLPAINQKATATSDYISLQPDSESMSAKQTKESLPGPSCMENEGDTACARALPFVGNCARTRKFTPEIFGKPRKLSEQDRIMSSSSSSISTTTIGEEMQASSSEDESFPLVTLSPMVSPQRPSENSHKPPNLALSELRAGSSQPLPVDDLAGTIHNEERDEVVQSPLEHEKILKETRISADPLANVISTKPKSPVVKSPSIMSPGVENNEYTLRLLQTIAKLSGDMSVAKPSCDTSVTGEKSRRSSVLSPPPLLTEEGESCELDDEPCTSLVISVDLSRLSRLPVPPPCPSETEVGVFTHRVGSFTSRGAQAERGLIIDSDDLERRLTVKVNEALCEMKEKLEKTERRVREVMKEKEQLEKILEAKLKMIKDLTTTGIKPVFVDKDTMTDPVKEFTEITANKKTKSKVRSTSTQTVVSGPRAERRTSGPSRCLSHLNDKELEQYLRVSPPASAAQSEDDDEIEASNDVVPASSKNLWMFESSDSARSSAFNLQVRFMRTLMQNAKDQDESTPSSVVSSSLLSRDLCSTFTKIQRLNQQLQVLPLASVLKEKVDVVTSNVSHLLSHLPIPKGGQYEDLVLLMNLSIGTSAYSVGWKIKELLALLTGINADRLPAYFKAELKLVMKHVQKALQFGIEDVKNVTVDHTLRPLEQAPIGRLIVDDTCESGDYDLDDILSSSDDDDNDQQKLNEEEVEVGGDRELMVARKPKPDRMLVQLGDRHNDKGQKKRRRRREKRTHFVKERRSNRSSPPPPPPPMKGKQLLVKGRGGKFVKSNKPEKSKASKTGKKVPTAAVSIANSSPIPPATVKEPAGTSASHTGGPLNTRTPLILRKPTAVVNTSSSNSSSVTVTPINRPIFPINPSNKHLSEPIQLLTSLAATMISRGIPVGKAVMTSTASSNSQPQVTRPANTALSSRISAPMQVQNIGTNTSSGVCMSGFVESSNLSLNTFTPIAKAISPTSKTSRGLNSLTTPSSSKNQQVSAVSVASKASSVQVTVLPKHPSSVAFSVSSKVQPQVDIQRRSNTATSSTLSLSSSTLPPAVIAASSLLSLPPGPWNRVPLSLPPSIVTASTIPALQNSARQVRVQTLTNAPAPLMRVSTLNSFPAPIGGTSKVTTPSVTPQPSVNMAPYFSVPVVAMNMSPLLSMPVVVPPSGNVIVATSLTTPTAASPSVVSSRSDVAMAPSLTTPTAASPSVISSRSDVAMAPSLTTPTAASPPVVSSRSNVATAPSLTTLTAASPSVISSRSNVATAPSLTAPTVAPPPIVTAALSHNPSLSSISTAPSSTTLPAPSSISSASSIPGVVTTSSISLPSNTSTSLSEASASPVLSSTVSTVAATPTTCTVTPVEVMDILPSLPESNRTTTTIVVIDPSPEAEPPPPSAPPATVSDATAASSSGSGSMPASSTVTVASSNSVDPESKLVSTSLPSSLSSSKSNSVNTAASSSLVEILSSTSALLTSLATQRLSTHGTPHSTVTAMTSIDDNSPGSPLAVLEPQRFQNLLAQYSSTHPLGMANREQSLSQGIQTLSAVNTGSQHKLRRSPRIRKQASISPVVAALKATIYRKQRSSPQRKASTPSSSTQGSSAKVSSQAVVSLSPSTSLNLLSTTRNANPTPEDLKMMYSQSPINSTTVVSTASASSNSASTAVIIIDDDEDSVTVASSEKGTSSASRSPSMNASQTNHATSDESHKSSTSSLNNSTSTPPIFHSENDGIKNDGITTPGSQEISSPTPPPNTTSDFVFPDGIAPYDIIPLMQVMHDTKGVLIKWTLPRKYLKLQKIVTTYELYAYIVKGESNGEIPPIREWSKVGVVHPLKLPMAVTLTNVIKTKKYFFCVRALFGSETCASQFSKPSGLREDS